MNEYDIVIIGGGPGGYSAAVRARRLGLSVALVEKEKIGGVFVNEGGLPTKTLLKYAKLRHKYDNRESDAWKTPPGYKNAQMKSVKVTGERSARIKQLLTDDGVAVFSGTARLAGAGIVLLQPSGEKLTGKSIIISTGSRPKWIPGIEYDGVNTVTTKEALKFPDAPSSVVIIGSGATGIEFATVWSSFGSKVTVLEMLPFVMGLDDEDALKTALDYFIKNDVDIKTSVKVESVIKTPEGLEVTFLKDGRLEKVVAEKALIAAGVVPNIEDLGLEELGVELERGYIKVDNLMRTNVPGIYAVGDVTGKLTLAMTATLQGITAAEAIVGNSTEDIVYENIPRCIYAGIQAASVGMCRPQAQELGIDVAAVTVPVTPFGKAINLKEPEGFMKLFSDAGSGRVIGAVLMGSDATDQIAIPARMMSLGSTAPEIAAAMRSGR